MSPSLSTCTIGTSQGPNRIDAAPDGKKPWNTGEPSARRNASWPLTMYSVTTPPVCEWPARITSRTSKPENGPTPSASAAPTWARIGVESAFIFRIWSIRACRAAGSLGRLAAPTPLASSGGVSDQISSDAYRSASDGFTKASRALFCEQTHAHP